MFNLFRSRDKAVRYLLTAFLSLVALSMVGYLIPGYGGGGMDSQGNIVATVGDEKLTTQDVQTTLQAAVRGKQVPPDMMAVFAPQLIDQMITERAVAYQAGQMGFKVTDDDVANVIRQTMPQLFPEGKFVGSEIYSAMLAQQNMTVQQFEDYMKRQFLINRLRSLVINTNAVTDAEIDREFRRRNEKAIISYIRIGMDKAKASVNVTDDEVRAHFEKNRANYKIPPKRNFKLLILDPAKVEAAMTVPEAAIERAYQNEKDRFRTPERVQVRHILFMTNGKPPADEPKIKAKAEEVLKKVKAGGDFAALAKENSEDPGSKEKGGDLGWIVRGQTVPEFEQSAFSLKPNEISNLIKTQYGYHIIQPLAKEDARLRPLSEVHDEIAAELKKQMAQDRLQTAIDSAAAELRKNPSQVAEIAARYSMTVVDANNIGANDPVPEVGLSPDFEQATMTLNKGEVSQPVEAPGQRTVIALVTDVLPERPAEFDEKKDEIRTALLTDKANKWMADKAAEARRKVGEMHGDVKAAAKALNLTEVTSPPFTRNGAIEGLGTADSIPDAFGRPAGSLFGPIRIGDAMVVGQVVQRIDPNMAELPGQVSAIRTELEGKIGRERNSMFEDGLRRTLESQGKLKINQDAIKRIVGAYRT